MFNSIFSKNTFKAYNINPILETKVFLFFIIFFCFAFQALSYFNLWTEQEVYSLHISQYLFSQYASEFLFALKPLFYSILKFSFSISSLFDGLPMTTARSLFAFNGLAILALLYFYIKNKTNRYNAVLAVLFIASLNIFLDRAFRVRSDLLATSLSLLCLLLNLNIKAQKDTWKFYILIPLLVFILLISPKGIYWIIFTSILLWHDMKKRPQPWLLAKATAFIFAFFCIVSWLFKDLFFIETFKQSTKFYLLNLKQTYHFIEQNSWLSSLNELSHIGMFINRNPFLVLITCLKAVFIFYSLVLSKNRKRDLSDLYFLVLIVILLFHPQQKLFFLSALSPFLCLAFWTDSEWKKLITNTYSKSFKSFLMAFCFIYAFFYISYFNYKIYTIKSNTPQKITVKELNTFYKNTDPSIHILDPDCLIYTRKTTCKYILYNQKFQDNFNSYIQNNRFDIVLSSFSLPVIKLATYNESRFEYVNIKNHIYYRAFIIDKANNFIETKENILKSIKSQQTILNNSWTPNQLLVQNTFKNQIKSLSKGQKILSGKKILENFEKEQQTAVPKQQRKYFYLYVDELNNSLNTIKACESKTFPLMKEGCYYSESELRKSFIPFTNKKMALFYLPFPLQLKSKKSLRILLRYDKF